MSKQTINNTIRYQDRKYGLTTNRMEETRGNFSINLKVEDVNPKQQSTQKVVYVERTNSYDRQENIEIQSRLMLTWVRVVGAAPVAVAADVVANDVVVGAGAAGVDVAGGGCDVGKVIAPARVVDAAPKYQ
ncbi:Hypothetical predicted protein [Octopus vulgaris]|uniref:Uncharacterized protein n=1 Tax=Octopus vulgaris TaxID=6645 RepID=A0AA36AK03_OCTVU|nr:Hypothetical predicted protein [Octopus vulgaris]